MDRSGPEIEVFDAWDPVARELEIAETGSYDYDSRDYLAANGLGVIDYDDRDSSEFRNYWLYMPQFRILDQNDFVTTMAVFLVLFIFIMIIKHRSEHAAESGRRGAAEYGREQNHRAAPLRPAQGL